MSAMSSVELLIFTPQSPRGTQMLEAFQHTLTKTDVRVTRTESYQGQSDILMLWGPGAPNRWPPMQAQAAKGGHTVAWDLPYTQRDTKCRCAIDAPHPQAWLFRKEWPAERLAQSEMPVSNGWNPDGPVLVAGIGPKAKVQYGAATVEDWEAQMIAACQKRGQVVRYRRKNGQGAPPAGVILAEQGSIEQALDGASLLMTWHSNVAVDAIRMGIPVVCRDGAAAAVCPSVLSDRQPPLAAEVQRRFLQSLAWFQWGTTTKEAAECWRFLKELLA